MHRRWLPIVFAAMVAVGCGSSSGSDTASSARTATTAPATSTATSTTTGTTTTTADADLRRLPQAPEPGKRRLRSPTNSRAFLREVFADTEALWRREFAGAGLTYHRARLTIFSQQVQTACGTHGSDVGPFYCPASFGVYLDPTFFAALSRHAGVDLRGFAQAYVIAHEVAHHVQTLLGLAHQKALADQQDPAGANARSVRYELQADCFAGVWMHSIYRRGQITNADIGQALDAAAVVGDDFHRNAAGERRPPEDWTHGSSAQRQRWLTIGFEQGRPGACDTSNA